MYYSDNYHNYESQCFVNNNEHDIERLNELPKCDFVNGLLKKECKESAVNFIDNKKGINGCFCSKHSSQLLKAMHGHSYVPYVEPL